ncbi:MAG: peptide chain release factor N(5)-glutamine methyltransferase [Actinomycetota bacterium]|nr:peptide chain release factor N(5)-glutamine methyltransferase [Actinomycetota bacterium]
MTPDPVAGRVAEILARSGFVAAPDEASELVACAAGDPDRLASLLARRLSGEPLAWVTGRAEFCGLEIRVDPGVYVPRWQSEPLARRAASLLPARGTAVDVCTGSGAVAAVMRALRPSARVLATERDLRAARCAAANGVEVYTGDLFDPLPAGIGGSVDVLVGIVPYVPSAALSLLPRDTFRFEASDAYDGGPDGTDVLRSVVAGAPALLRPGGSLLLELGADQAELLADALRAHRFSLVGVIEDEEGDVRGLEATLRARRGRSGASGRPAPEAP